VESTEGCPGSHDEACGSVSLRQEGIILRFRDDPYVTPALGDILHNTGGYPAGLEEIREEIIDKFVLEADAHGGEVGRIGDKRMVAHMS
jgi:hypothetical protein